MRTTEKKIFRGSKRRTTTNGRVIKGVAGDYVVIGEDNLIYVCRGRMTVKRTSGKLFVGDNVEFMPLTDNTGVIEKITARRNYLVRPPVANIERILILISTVPPPDLTLIDKMIVFCKVMSIDVYVAVNKADLGGVDKLYDEVVENYRHDAKGIEFISTKTGENLDKLEFLKSGITCLVGQSAVGKSSLINALKSNCEMEIGELSEKINRGKNTTRLSQIVPLDFGGYIIDTPGFTFLNLNVDHRDLKDYYEDFYLCGKCRYKNCTHINEPDCAVIKAVEEGSLNRGRYERYLSIYRELENKWRNKYD